MSAYSELVEELYDGEVVESIVFGPWGWGSAPKLGEDWEAGYDESEPPPIPFDVRGKLLSLDQAEPMMRSWSFFGGFGAPNCYAVYVWTNMRVLWVTQYDGSTGLDSAPRNPVECLPTMPGG